MNRNNNLFNKNEIENKLKDFKEGKDYSISPADEPNIETYNFYNDKLRSVFRGDRVPVRIKREAYDDKDYTYRGHFEEGKDYSYSSQYWDYSKGRNDYRETRSLYYPKPVEEWVKNALERGDIKKGISIYIEGGKVGENGLEKHWESKEHYENSEVKMRRGNEKDWLAKKRNRVEKEEQDNNQSQLTKENHELKQQLAEVQKQLAEVLTELKKLKSNSTGQNNEKLDQQIVQNQKLIENGEKVSQAEVKEQVQKSQALLKEASVGVVSTKDNQKDNSFGSLPYIIGGFVVVIGLLAS
jgi:hypothetical protein